MPERRIPLTVIGGFLGAGKTTLLNHWLGQAGAAGRPRRLAVLVNDFGALDIDAALIRGAGGDTIALSNGCVCCQIGDDLSAALIRLLAAPEPVDAVVVEASGVSDPWRIAQIGLADPALSLGGVVVLVDGAALPGHAGDPLLADTLQRQLDAADLVVLNKLDQLRPGALPALRRWLDEHASGVPRLETMQAALPLALLDELQPHAPAPFRGCRCGHDHAGGHPHGHPHGDAHGDAHGDPHGDAGGDPRHGELFDTWSAQPDGLLSAAALRAAQRAMPPGVLRLKGLLRTDELGWSEWQFAGRHGSLRRALAPPAGGAALVAIGLRGRLPHAALQALIDGARLAA